MVRYAFNRQVTPAAPFVHLTVSAPSDGAPSVEVPAQIDTGADVTIIPGRLVDALNLVPLDSISAVGLGGHLVTLPTFLVELRIRELNPVKIKVLASHDEPFALIGRDMLNRYTILLDGPNLALEIH